MRAQLYDGSFRPITVERPTLIDGDVLARITLATVCGSDHHTVTGRRSAPTPTILGHEAVAVVVESRREGIEVGDRIVFSVTESCRACDRCRAGLTAKCRHLRKVGHERFNGRLDGTYATHIHLSAGHEIAIVPEHVPDAPAATAGCAIATVMAVAEAAGELAGRTVLVTGLGMLGLTAVAAARALGAGRVLGVDPSAAARVRAGDLSEVFADVPDVPVDAVMELSGMQESIDSSLGVLGIGGTAVLAGSVVPSAPTPVDPEWVVRGWRTITGVHNYEPRHLHQAVEFLATHGETLPWEQLLGQRYPLDDLPRAFCGEAGRRAIVEN